MVAARNRVRGHLFLLVCLYVVSRSMNSTPEGISSPKKFRWKFYTIYGTASCTDMWSIDHVIYPHRSRLVHANFNTMVCSRSHGRHSSLNLKSYFTFRTSCSEVFHKCSFDFERQDSSASSWWVSRVVHRCSNLSLTYETIESNTSCDFVTNKRRPLVV